MRPMTTIRTCNPADEIDRLRPLLEQNWAETGFDFPFNPSVEMYRVMHDVGVMFGLIAEIDGEPVGYCSVCVSPHPHNPAVIVGSNDALFVAPAHRGGTVAPRLIAASERLAREQGATRFCWHCRAGTPLADTFARHGYTPADTVVMKEI